VIPGITLCSGGTVANGRDFKRATDPWLSFGPDGDLYMFSLSLDLETPPGRAGGFGKNALFVSESKNGGQTWSDPIQIIRDENPKFLNDKNSITADPTDSNFVYAVWDRLELPNGTVINPENVVGFGFKGPAMLSRTTDGGATWEPARIIYNPGGNNQVVVLPNGTVVDFFDEILGAKNVGGTSRVLNLALVRSTDHGATWAHGQAIRAAKMFPRVLFVGGCCGVYNPENPAEVSRTEDLIPEVAVGTEGNLYAVWQDARFSNGGNFSNPALLYDDVAFSMSTDGGDTWSTPVRINKTPTNIPVGNRQAFTPSVHVSSDGTVGVTYYDFRNNDTGADLKTDYFIVHCHASCTDPGNWSETQVTDVSFDMRQAPVARGFFTGDYEGLASAGSDFTAFFSQGVSAADPASIFFRKVGP